MARYTVTLEQLRSWNGQGDWPGLGITPPIHLHRLAYASESHVPAVSNLPREGTLNRKDSPITELGRLHQLQDEAGAGDRRGHLTATPRKVPEMKRVSEKMSELLIWVNGGFRGAESQPRFLLSRQLERQPRDCIQLTPR